MHFCSEISSLASCSYELLKPMSLFFSYEFVTEAGGKKQ